MSYADEHLFSERNQRLGLSHIYCSWNIFGISVKLGTDRIFFLHYYRRPVRLPDIIARPTYPGNPFLPFNLMVSRAKARAPTFPYSSS